MLTLWIGILLLSFLGLIAGATLGYSSIRFKNEADPIVDTIDAALPQSQCAQCGYPGCRPYAEAVASGDSINKCIPGGETVMLKLADLMGTDPLPMNETAAKPVIKIALIDENNCIGCTKCMQACPVDAIVGAKKLSHTIIRDYCTGCELCLPPCPMDCIAMVTPKITIENWQWDLHNIPVRTLAENENV